jgi:hypothetical protein
MPKYSKKLVLRRFFVFLSMQYITSISRKITAFFRLEDTYCSPETSSCDLDAFVEYVLISLSLILL